MLKLIVVLLALLGVGLAQDVNPLEYCNSGANSTVYSKWSYCTMLNNSPLDAYFSENDQDTVDYVAYVDEIVQSSIDYYHEALSYANVDRCESCTNALKTYLCMAYALPKGFSQCYWGKAYRWVSQRPGCNGTGDCPSCTTNCCPCSLNVEACKLAAQEADDYIEDDVYSCFDIPSSFCKAVLGICFASSATEQTAFCGDSTGNARGLALPGGSCPANFTGSLDYFRASANSTATTLVSIVPKKCTRVWVQPTRRTRTCSLFRCETKTVNRGAGYWACKENMKSASSPLFVSFSLLVALLFFIIF